jgi:hypothetical protein
MKYIITESQYKKALNEQGYLSDELSKEERAEEIIRRKNHIEKLLPKIIKYFKIKYRDELEKIEIEYVRTWRPSEDLSLENPRINFYFNESSLPNRAYGISGDLRDVFNIDVSMYGVPLSFRILEKTWKIVHG